MNAPAIAKLTMPSDPFRELHARRDALRELKRVTVKLGNSGDRWALKLARMLFAEIPGLRNA
jgi:hypothetical protein